MNRILLLVLVALLSACSNNRVNTPVTLTIGVNDPLAKKSACSCAWDIANRVYEPMIAQIEKETGIKLVFDYHGEAISLAEDVNSGKYDGYIAKPWSGITWANASKRQCETIADLSRKSGKSELYGVFVALSDSKVKQIADINGKRLGIGPDSGFEKNQLVKSTLKAQKVSPSSFVEYPACQTGLIALHDGLVDVAAVSDYAMAASCISDIFPPEDFTVIAETDQSIPFVSFFLDTKKVSVDTQEILTKALLKFTDDRVPAGMNCPGWLPAAKWNPTK